MVRAEREAACAGIRLRWFFVEAHARADFLVVALVAGLFGFTGIAGTASDIARILFYIFLVLLVISLLVGAFRGKTPL